MGELEHVKFLQQQIKGAINIGLEDLETRLGLEPLTSYKEFYLQKLFRFGLSILLKVQKQALGIPPEKLQQISQNNNLLFGEIAGIRENPPRRALEVDSEDVDEQVVEYLVFEHLGEVEALEEKILSL